MKKLSIKTDISVYDTPEALADPLRELLALAHLSLADAYAPYSNFQVGAAVLLNNGIMLKGSNQENAAYSVCICAERVALSAAASQYPKVGVKAIAITARSPRTTIQQPISPCGTCRQFMVEVEDKLGQAFQVILQGEEGPIYVVDSAKDLLPLSFDASYL